MNWIEFIFRWQTLIGAVLGGMFALATALIVAYSMRRREVVAAGMIVITNLTAVRIALEAINSLPAREGISENEFPLWFSDRLVGLYPGLSTLFEASVAQVMPVDVYLAAHLTLFQRIYSQIGIMVEKLSVDYDHFREHGKPLRPEDDVIADCKLISRHFPMAVKHAECAEEIIGKLVLSHFPTWNKVRYFFHVSEQEKKCRKMLKMGSSS